MLASIWAAIPPSISRKARSGAILTSTAIAQSLEPAIYHRPPCPLEDRTQPQCSGRLGAAPRMTAPMTGALRSRAQRSRFSHSRILARSARRTPDTSSSAARLTHSGPSPRFRLASSSRSRPHRQHRKNSQVLSAQTTMYRPDHRFGGLPCGELNGSRGPQVTPAAPRAPSVAAHRDRAWSRSDRRTPSRNCRPKS